MAREATVLNTQELARRNREAVRHRRNRTLTNEFIKTLDKNGVHIVAFSMPHNGVDEVRTRILCKVEDSMDPVEVWLDMNIKDFNNLRKVEVPR